MLSQSSFKKYELELLKIRDYGSILRIAAKNATDIQNLKKSDFVKKYDLKSVSYTKLEDAQNANSELTDAFEETSFFYYISNFERVCYEIAKSGVKQTKDFHSNADS